MAEEGVFDRNVPAWRFTHIPQDVLPMLRSAGVSDGTIKQLMVENPRRFFEQNAAY
jgi:phosphotriesterase-related protein